MPKFFVNEEQIKENHIQIVGSDVNHIKNVLRQKIGNQITICNEAMEQDYICEIEKIEEKSIECKIIEKLKSDVESNVKVTIFQGLPKADKMELVIQKSVELGVYNIIPVEMKRCVVKLNEKDKIKKRQRWQKISEVAAKQSGRSIIPKIENIISIKNVCNMCDEYDILLLAYENERENTLKQELNKIKELEKKEIKIGIIIGPEGGIDEKEVKELNETGAKVITLGKRILRTETVALNVLSIIMYELEN